MLSQVSFLVSSNILSSLMEIWCNTLVENQSFFGQNEHEEGSLTLYSTAVHEKFWCEDTLFPLNPLHILLTYKQTTEYICKRVSQQTGAGLFTLQSNVEKISCFPKCK